MAPGGGEIILTAHVRSAYEPSGIEVTELLRHDLGGLARCMSLDAEAFPYPSIPLGLPPGLQTLVATAGDPTGPVGFLTSTATSATRYIHGLAVVASHRRRGIGRLLLRACIDGARAAGIRSVDLHVGAANRPAVLLYDRAGFELRRVLRDHYRPGLYASRDAYELTLPLGRVGSAAR